MRVVRIKHKAGIVFLLVVCAIMLLLLISRKSDTVTSYEHGSLVTRSVDFINIAKQVVGRRNPGDILTQRILHNTVKTGDKSRNRQRNKPRPPKRRKSDGVVDQKVVKNVVHGDDLHGVLGRANGLSNRNKYKTTRTSKGSKATEVSKSSNPGLSHTIALLVIACNRPDAVKRCLNGLLKHRPSAKQFPIIVSQDCGDKATAEAISAFRSQVKHIKQPDLSAVGVPANMRHFQGYYKISRHYKWALGQAFDDMSYDTVLIVEDDLDIAPDFYDYFLATRVLLDKDPSIWCVSAWNDNGKEGMIDASANGKLYRADFFPGLGWMMKKSLWQELKLKWPTGFWDDWMRESAQRKGRACIRPEISRTKTFGRFGVSQGQFFDQHLKYIVLNDKKFDFLHQDLSYLIKKKYDGDFLQKIAALPVLDIEKITGGHTIGHKAVRVTYMTEHNFNSLAIKLGAMVDFKAGVPRTGYHGIVTVIFNGVRVYITPKEITK